MSCWAASAQGPLPPLILPLGTTMQWGGVCRLGSIIYCLPLMLQTVPGALAACGVLAELVSLCRDLSEGRPAQEGDSPSLCAAAVRVCGSVLGLARGRACLPVILAGGEEVRGCTVT